MRLIVVRRVGSEAPRGLAILPIRLFFQTPCHAGVLLSPQLIVVLE
jgi:hypothetical protein